MHSPSIAEKHLVVAEEVITFGRLRSIESGLEGGLKSVLGARTACPLLASVKTRGASQAGGPPALPGKRSQGLASSTC